MKASLALAMMAAVLAASPARAQSTPAICEVPAYLLSSDSRLSKVAAALKSDRKLDILVMGSRSSTIETSPGTAYPARLEAILREKLPTVSVNIGVELFPKKTAEETVGDFAKLVEQKKPALVIWQTGTVDAVRSIDVDDFRTAVDAGVAALQNAGTDVILMNLQYSPRTETMISAIPYLDNMRAVAQLHDIPLFDRFAVMRHWNEQGDFDLFSTSHGLDMAKRVHDCLARALSTFMIDAARVNPTELRTQR
jgi:hypothetical protein